MAKGAFIGVNGVARKVSNKYIGVNGVARKISKGYIGVGGVARQFWPGGEPLSGLPVGSIVSTPVNGVSKNFIVVHQGIPSAVYDSSCNGTWLLMEDIYEKRVCISSGSNLSSYDYAISDIYSYLNDTFINLFDSGIKSAIKQVKIPYFDRNYSSGSVKSGSDGLSAKVFLLSYTEVGFSELYYAPVEGAVLSYFNGASDSKRVANFNGNATDWWLRSPNVNSTNTVFEVSYNGDWETYYNINPSGVRPAFVLPSDAAYAVENGVNVLVT